MRPLLQAWIGVTVGLMVGVAGCADDSDGPAAPDDIDSDVSGSEDPSDGLDGVDSTPDVLDAEDAQASAEDTGGDSADVPAIPDAACIGTACDETLCSPANVDGTCPGEMTCWRGACIFEEWNPAPPNLEVLQADLESVWTTVAEQYAAFAAKRLDWAAVLDEFSDRLQSVGTQGEGEWTIVSMVRTLEDGHTYALRSDVCATALPYVQNVSDVGACLEEDDAGVFVYAVQPGNPTGLQVGDRLIGIDDRSVEDALSDRLAQPRCTANASTPEMARRAALHSLLYRGRDGETLRIQRPANGSFQALDVAVERAGTTLACDGRLPPVGLSDYGAGVVGGPVQGGVFYLYFPFFGSYDESFQLIDGPILEALRSAFTDALDAPGIVLDLRANGGGYVTVYAALASWLYPDVTDLFTCRNKTGPGPDDFGPSYPLTAFPDPTLNYPGPVAVLTSPRSFSAADFTPGFLSWTGRALTFGEPTGGGFGSGGGGPIDNGWSVGVNTTECADLDGNLLEGGPPPVDVPVTLVAADAAAGVDSVIAAAVAWIVEDRLP